jgi:hypothetical protein
MGRLQAAQTMVPVDATVAATAAQQVNGNAAASHKLPSKDAISLKPQIAKGYVPQGQGVDREKNWVVTTYYQGPTKHGGNPPNAGTYLSIHAAGGKPADAALTLTTLGGFRGGQAPKHAGGVACAQGKYFVSDTHGIYVYDREALRKHAAPVPASNFIPFKTGVVKDKNGTDLYASGSFITTKGNKLYVGGYVNPEDPKGRGKPAQEGALYQWNIEKDGSLTQKKGPVACPPRAQGMTAVNGGFLFATGSKELIYQSSEVAFGMRGPLPSRTSLGQLRAFPQGINVVGADLFVTYESGATKYQGGSGTQAIQKIPIASLARDVADPRTWAQ